jgi:hypothetical protein
MKLTGLFGFVTVMWIIILVESAFLVFVVPTVDRILLRSGYSRLIVSLIEASISISSVVVLIFLLNKMKNVYMQKKLQL